ncbi:MAG: helix-turn-helix domain-containing protein [Kiritimatiellae bacterium]|nr:helix-turn-helix domain-containing protein [Kiritimatiellia bacterium]
MFGFSGTLQEDLERYQGVMKVAVREGWQVLGVHEQFERSLTRLVAAGAVDAVIGDFISEAWLGDLPDKIPMVHLGRHLLSDRISAVAVDAAAVGRRAARHLRAAGYKEVYVLAHSGHPASRLQAEAFATETGTDPETLLLRTLEALWQILEKKPGTGPEKKAGTGPVGVFCFSDFQARQVVIGAARRGIVVPNELGVLGVGNRFWDGVAAGMGLSSIPLPQVALGSRAAELLVERLRGQAPRGVRLPPGEVIPRESTLRSDFTGRLQAEVEGVFRGNLAEPPEMEALSRRVGMSRSVFERAFREEVGTTPYARMLDLRLEESQRLLRHTGWSVARIGEVVGYPEPAGFSAFFRRRAGISPSQWREENVSESERRISNSQQ